MIILIRDTVLAEASVGLSATNVARSDTTLRTAIEGEGTKMPDYDKVGSIYVKSYSRRTIASDGAEVCMAAKVLPPYVQPREYWASWRIIGDGSGVVPDGGAYYNMRLAGLPMDPRQQKIETDDVTGDEFMGRYLNPVEGAYPNTSDAVASDLGIPGDEPSLRSDFYKKREWFKHRSFLGLPDKAVFNNADLILYTDKISKHGKVRVPGPIDVPKFVGAGMVIDVPTLSSDWGDIMWGDEINPGLLSLRIVQELGEFNTATRAIDTGSHDSNLLTYLTQGFGNAIDVDQQVHCRFKLTIRCDVFTPTSKNIITIS